jgi:putative ABC transport system permease protein
MKAFEQWFLGFTADWRNPVGLGCLLLLVLLAILFWDYTRFMLKTLRRNLLRTLLTAVATFMLVLVVTAVWSILAFIDRQIETKSKDLKAIVSERYQIPSMMPYAYADSLATGAARTKDDYRVNPDKDAMLWAFYGGTLDPQHRTRENTVFFFAMEPRKLISMDSHGKFSSMMEDIDQVSDEDKRKLVEACQEMERNPNKVVIGPSRLAQLNKKVGERFKVSSLNYKDIDLEFEILGVLPGGRYELSAVMNYNYLDQELKKYNQGKSKDQQHPMTEKTLALMWVRVPDMATFDRVAQQVTSSPDYKSPAVKCETASSGIATFLDPYKDILWGLRWILAPALLGTMTLVIANAISISVRERRTEMAVLKVLGYTPNQILVFVLGEALLIGCLSGLVSAVLAKVIVNDYFGGLPLPIAFFGKFYIADPAPWWGLMVGAGTALAGSLVPAWSARSVKVSEVFAKVA